MNYYVALSLLAKDIQEKRSIHARYYPKKRPNDKLSPRPSSFLKMQLLYADGSVIC